VFQAIASMLSKSIDIYLKINSTDVRRRKFGKTMYDIYRSLGDVDASMEKIRHAILIQAKEAHDRYVMTETVSWLSPVAKEVNKSIGKLAELMEAESWDFWDIATRPELLRRISVFDQDLVMVVADAWFEDGGFVEALARLGLFGHFDRKVLRLLDAEFDPKKHGAGRVHGYEVAPRRLYTT
jgi:hypothetical protein